MELDGLSAGRAHDRTLFPLGEVVATRNAWHFMASHDVNPIEILRRHASGDWGDVPPEDARENALSVKEGFRILSSYEESGRHIWIITEADRSYTTILMPEDY